MITYSNIIILCYIDKAILQILILSNDQYISSFAHRYKFNSDCIDLINHDLNAIVTIK